MQRMFVTLAVMALLAAAFMTGCAKANEAELIANSGDTTATRCDTANSKYSTVVMPILQTNCYSCHSGSNVNAGVSLDSYTQLRSLALSGTLIGVITHASGYPAMPEGKPQLSDCDINKIRSWINNGAQNN